MSSPLQAVPTEPGPQSTKPEFLWDDPFRLDEQLGEDERAAVEADIAAIVPEFKIVVVITEMDAVFAVEAAQLLQCFGELQQCIATAAYDTKWQD